MDARTSKRQKKISSKQEQRMAEDLGGRVMPASGAMANAKSDVRAFGVVRAEAKYTAKESYSLKLADLDKIINEAGLESAVLQLCFVDRSNRPLATFAIFPAKSPFVAIKAELQSFKKSMLIGRDRMSLWLMKKPVHLVFSDFDKNRWFRVMDWKDYLTMMEELNA